MQLLRTIVAVPAIALCCMTAMAQSASAPTTTSSGPVAQPEVAIAKAELDMTRKHQEQLVSIVLWSLGTLAAVAALLVSYSWWNNSRNYDRDKAAFERELRTLLADAITKLSEEQRTTFQARIESLEKRLGGQLLDAEARLSSGARETIEVSQKEMSAQVTQLKSSLVGIRTGLRRLQLAGELRERLEALSIKTYRNALQHSVSALEFAVKINDDYEIGNVLDLVAEDFTTILASDDLPIDNFLIGQLVAVLDAVKGSHAHAAAALKSKAPQLLNK